MRLSFVVCFLTISIVASSQLYIGNSAQFQLTGNVQMTLADMSFINNGSFSPGTSSIYFTGNDNSGIAGTNLIQFYRIYINKSAGDTVILQRSINVTNTVNFSQGLIDLNGFDLDLGNSGTLVNEQENSRITGITGGNVMFSTTLNTPAAANPGNLGAIISSAQNLGSVTIRRGHRYHTLTGDNSILRYYRITPTNNTGLDATIRFQYFDAELNGLPEASLSTWRSIDGIAWTYQNFSIRNVSQNYVEKTGIDQLAFLTLSTPSATLPVELSAFNLKCDADKVILQWKTVQELNSSHFIVERNTGNSWIPIGRQNAAGNSSAEKSYEFIDNTPIVRAYYRIAQYDLDGRVKYTSIVLSDCSTTEVLQAWPNPLQQSFTLKIGSNRNGAVAIRIVDSKGVLILSRRMNLLNGINQFDVDLKNAAAGVYILIIEGMNGLPVRSIRLVKD